MKERLAKLQARIDAMSVRERGIIFLTLVLALFMVWDSVLLQPEQARQERALERINTLQAEIAALDQQAEAIVKRHNLDPNADTRRELQRYGTQLEALDERIANAVEGLVSPRQMGAVLEEILTRETDLKLVSVENLGGRPLLEEPAGEDGGAGQGIGVYVHGLRLEFEGSYLSTLQYLRALKGLDRSFYWDELRLETLEYPAARVVIGVHTLSLSREWIGV